jgi:hypothetical protein
MEGDATFQFISNHLLEVQAHGGFSGAPTQGEGFLVILQQIELLLGELSTWVPFCSIVMSRTVASPVKHCIGQ